MIQIAYAAVDPAAFGRVVDPIIDNIVKPVMMLLFAVGLVVFAWGIIEMIIKGDDADARSKGRTHMLSGAFGMFIMVSAWGIIYLISNTIKGI